MFISRLTFAVLWFFGRWFPPQFAKTLFLWGIKSQIFPSGRYLSPHLRTSLFGKTIHSPVGLAAEFDYTGEIVDSLIQLGLGFGEVGSYTSLPNFSVVRRSFLRHDNAIRVQTDEVNNPGIKKAADILASRRYLPHLVGVDLVSFGMEERNSEKGLSVYTYLEDYKQMTLMVAPYVDYIVINLSHPNSALCQVVSDETAISPLIQTVQEAARIAAPLVTPKIVVKVPFDLSDLEIKSLAGTLVRTKVDAAIVAGAAVSGKNIRQSMNDPLAVLDRSSVILGEPLQFGTIRLIKRFYCETQGELCLIASGGIHSGKDAYEAIAAGASAVEIYSALLLKGPRVIQQINSELLSLMKRNRIKTIAELVGRNSEL